MPSVFGVCASTQEGARLAARHLQGSSCLQSLRVPEVTPLGAASFGAVSEAPGCHETLVASRGRLLLAFSGRIDNAREVRETLGLPSTASATQLLAKAYSRWGQQCASRVVGEYVWSIWDEARQRLLLVRDALGIHHLYYSLSRGGVVFASELGTLLGLPGLCKHHDERAIIDYLGGFPEDPERTVYADVKRLPPGSFLSWTPREVRVERYYHLDPTREVRMRNDAEYADALHEKLQRAVRRRLPTHGSVGLLLSGGLDSSAVACLAGPLLANRGTRLTTISCEFPDHPQTDESYYQKAVARHVSSRHEPIRVDFDNSHDLEELVRTFAQPLPIGPHWLAWPAVETAKAANVDVVLTGLDGDRVVWHGNGTFEELAADRRFLELARLALQVKKSVPLATRTVVSHVLRETLPRSLASRLERWRLRRHYGSLPQLNRLAPRLLAVHDVVDRLVEQQRHPRTCREAHFRMLSAPSSSHDTELLAGLSTRFGVQITHPFFDREVVEFCLALPADQKLRAGVSRFVLRNAIARDVPPEVSTRATKVRFDEAYTAWLDRQLAPGARRGLDVRLVEPYLSPHCISELKHGRPHQSPGIDLDFYWRCVVLSACLEASAKSMWETAVE